MSHEPPTAEAALDDHPVDFYNEAVVRLVMMAKTTELTGGARHMIMPRGS